MVMMNTFSAVVLTLEHGTLPYPHLPRLPITILIMRALPMPIILLRSTILFL